MTFVVSVAIAFGANGVRALDMLGGMSVDFPLSGECSESLFVELFGLPLVGLTPDIA